VATRTRATIGQHEVDLAVRGQLGDATVLSWQTTHLGRGRGDNSSSLGVERVQGRARTPRGDVPWTQIRKVLVRPVDPAEDDLGHWNHWRREPLVLASGTLSHLPPGVAAPAVHLVAPDDAGDRVAVWMEDAGDEPADGWTPQRLLTVAHRLGRLAGGFLHHQLTEPWWSRDLLGQWVALLPARAQPLHSTEAAGWDDPRIRAVYPSGRVGPVAAVLDAAPALLAGLDGSPMTLCHRDCGLDNLRLRGGGRGTDLVLFDWALAGIGPVGEDLGLLLASGVRRWPDEPYGLGRRLLAAYLDGVASNAGHGVVAAAAVWRTAVTTAALREALFAAAQLAGTLDEGRAGAGRVARFAADAPAIEVLAAEALRLGGAAGRRHGSTTMVAASRTSTVPTPRRCRRPRTVADGATGE
jgi:hypothetical protein